jgi:hypothetical protein
MMRCRPGTAPETAFAKVPDQRRTAARCAASGTRGGSSYADGTRTTDVGGFSPKDAGAASRVWRSREAGAASCFETAASRPPQHEAEMELRGLPRWIHPYDEAEQRQARGRLAPLRRLFAAAHFRARFFFARLTVS